MIFSITIEDTTKGPRIYLAQEPNDVLDNPAMSLAAHMAASMVETANTIRRTLHMAGTFEVKH